MTDPVIVEAPQLISVGTQSMVSRAASLGLTWTLRRATVTASTAGAMQVTYDADTAPVNCVNLTGELLSLGDRVMGMIVPPSGNFIIGFAGNPTLPAGVVGYVGEQTSTSSISAEAVFARIENFTFLPGRAYKIQISCALDGSTVNVSGSIRVRYTSASGTVILGPRGYEIILIGGKQYEQSSIVVNNTGIPLFGDVVATINCVAPNTVQVRGTVDTARELTIEDMGLVARFPGAVEL